MTTQPGPSGQFETYATYVPAARGDLFVLGYFPVGGLSGRRAVLCLPPFAEELNKSRRMLSLQGMRLAAAGIPFVLPDLFGTGDSDGEFGDATVETWRDDLRAVADWLATGGVTAVDLLAVRNGVFLADAPAAALGARRVALWSPVTSGARMLKQLLRTRLVTAADGSGGTTPEALLGELESTGFMELAGYRFGRDLWRSIESQGIGDVAFPSGCAVHWFDVSVRARPEPPPATTAELERWSRAGAASGYTSHAGPPFWLGPEIELVEDLLSATTDFFAEPVA